MSKRKVRRWNVEFEDGDRILIFENTTDRDFVAIVPQKWNKAKENAKLISKAPQMLDMLKEAMLELNPSTCSGVSELVANKILKLIKDVS